MENKRSNSALIAVIIVILTVFCFICAICGGAFLLLGSFDAGTYTYTDGGSLRETTVYGAESASNKILSIPISGVIYADQTLDGASGGLFGAVGTFGYQIKDELREAADDSSIDGVILEINSPGGTVNGSQAIADAVAEYREKTSKPIYVHVSGLAASGGYFAAARADRIIADQGSLVGSIGVISGPYKFYDKVLSESDGLLGGSVLTQNGIESTYYTAGGSKDTGSPYRRLTAEEVNILQRGLNYEYDNFVQIVSKGRNIDASQIKSTIKAHLYDIGRAQELKLIDEIGNRETAYAEIAQKAGIEDDYQVVRNENSLGFFESLFGVVTGRGQNSVQAQSSGQSQTTLPQSQSTQLQAYPGQIMALYLGAVR